MATLLRPPTLMPRSRAMCVAMPASCRSRGHRCGTDGGYRVAGPQPSADMQRDPPAREGGNKYSAAAVLAPVRRLRRRAEIRRRPAFPGPPVHRLPGWFPFPALRPCLAVLLLWAAHGGGRQGEDGRVGVRQHDLPARPGRIADDRRTRWQLLQLMRLDEELAGALRGGAERLAEPDPLGRAHPPRRAGVDPRADRIRIAGAV